MEWRRQVKATRKAQVQKSLAKAGIAP